ncbi:MAG: DMT family transporter [Paeniclostridium sordellii]|uniref:DMT family transporter n=1 Tax=Paeniclostridium hominis TaxID=2764329 RepID=A0ABR7K4Z4_9FIRM|nr:MULTISPECIES: DMT family transporter [Paeniclostridium]MBC6004082.1 DMT family transporter [Paeniclostridium hominis]MDU2591737.1 DMT family transporter [Paeniclostridium sordellii]
MEIKNIGLFSGAMSGMLWGLDTVLTSIVLSLSPFIETKEAIFLAPFVSAFLHDLFSSLWMILYSLATKQLSKVIEVLKTRSGKFICIAAIFGGPIGMASYLLAIKYIGPGYTASISSIYPAVGAFWAYIFLKEKLSKRGFLGLILSIISVIILGYSPDKIISSNYLLGFGLALICVMGWSLESVICAYGMREDEVSPTQALQIRQVVSTLFYGLIIIPLINGLDLTEIVMKSDIFLFIGFIALFGTASYIFYYTAIDSIGPVKATALNITYSIWAIVFDVIILRNAITIKLIICSIFIIIGSIMVSKN